MLLELECENPDVLILTDKRSHRYLPPILCAAEVYPAPTRCFAVGQGWDLFARWYLAICLIARNILWQRAPSFS
jgi:hypothetical protein